MNRRLPPHAWLALHNKTPGDHLDKLVSLGVIKFDGDRTVRMMADNRHAVGRACPSVSLSLSVARRPGAFPSHWRSNEPQPMGT